MDRKQQASNISLQREQNKEQGRFDALTQKMVKK